MLLVVVENLLSLGLLAECVTGKEEVLLPRKAGADAEDRRSDCRELRVKLVLAQLAAEDQIGLQCGDRLEVEVVVVPTSGTPTNLSARYDG